MTVVLTLLASLAAAQPSLILHNGKVWVSSGRVEAAIALENGRVAAVGPDAKILAMKGPATEVVDLKGRLATPGFHDAHVHFMKGSLTLVLAGLGGSKSAADAAAKAGAWADANPASPYILGRGWDHTAWDGRLPTAAQLDAVVSTRPAVLTHVDGHILWLNTAALARSGILASTMTQVAGAKIERDIYGRPTGIVDKAGSALLAGVEPEPDLDLIRRALEKGLAHASASGVTAIQGPIDVNPRLQLQAWRRLNQEGKVHVHWFIWGKLEDPTGFAMLEREFADLPRDRFTFGGLKGFVDGVLSNRTAALLAPYSDDASTRGELKLSTATLRDQIARAGGKQVVLHAVGDAGVQAAIDQCGSLKRPRVADFSQPAPCKIEHIEVIGEADVARMLPFGMVASLQPDHMTYDDPSQSYNDARLGPRVRMAFPWKSFEKAGTLMAFGTDWPVMPLRPQDNLFAATTRRHYDQNPPEGWVPEQKISLESALSHYTLDPARAIGRADLGTLEVGKRADLAVFDRDLFALPPADLLKPEIALTIFDGRIVYQK